MSEVANRFSAAGSAIGYVTQVEYGLLLTLLRMNAEEDFSVSIETLDDIVFEDSDGASPTELWQVKHHILGEAKSLGDASEDLWKTLHNWIEFDTDGVNHYLITTSKASENSIASFLSRDKLTRDINKAESTLRAIATKGGNKKNEAYYSKFLALRTKEAKHLLRRIHIVDRTPTATNVENELLKAVRLSAPAHRRLPLVERLRGWWLGRALKSLMSVALGHPDPISMVEVEERVHYINASLRDDNLPLDYGDSPEPTTEEMRTDDRVFVEQLRLISLHSERIRMAICDHNRAFMQRSRWQREQLVDLQEMSVYDRRLIQEWRRRFLPATDSNEQRVSNDEDAARNAGRELFFRLEQSSLPEVRSALHSGYIPMGSLHMLADQQQVGWHPDWLARIRSSIRAAEGPGLTEDVA